MNNLFIERYTDIKQLKGITVRDKSRKIVLDTLSFAFSAAGIMNSALKRPRVQFLYIHHIFKDEEVQLKKLVEKLLEDHTFISYSEAVNRILTGTIDKPYVCISSDDGLKNNLHAGTILNDYGVKACFFICPSMIDEGDYEKVKSFSASQLHLPPVEFMNWNDIDELQKQGHEIGGHTMSHVNLANCSRPQLIDEIGICYREIEKQCGAVKHFSYPYGRFHHFTSEAKDIVFSTGFQSCASAERGCHVVLPNAAIEQKDLFIRRDHILLDWPLQHILFFMARNAQRADIKNNYSPYNENSNNNKS